MCPTYLSMLGRNSEEWACKCPETQKEGGWEKVRDVRQMEVEKRMRWGEGKDDGDGEKENKRGHGGSF